MTSVSIIIPCFNRQRWIGEAIESALAQGEGCEVIVVDDGSTDRSAEIIASFPAVRAVRIDNAGPSAARNEGLRIARGKFVRFLDSDDRLPAGSTQILAQSAKRLAARQIAFGDAGLIDDRGQPTTGVEYGYARTPPGGIERATLLSRAMSAPLPLFPATALREVGGFDKRLRLGEDHELATRLSLAGFEFVHVPAMTYQVREHSDDRLSRVPAGQTYAALADTFETIWRNLRAASPGEEERRALGRMAWASGRAASRHGFAREARKLFGLAGQIAGAEARNAPLPLRLAYRLLSPYAVERMSESVKTLLRSRSG